MIKATQQPISIEVKEGQEVEIKPGTFFVGKTTWTDSRSKETLEDYEVIFVYDVFEKQNKYSTSTHCRFLIISWSFCFGPDFEDKSHPFVSSQTGRIDGLLTSQVIRLTRNERSSTAYRGLTHTFSINDAQDLRLLVQKGKTLREIIADAVDEKYEEVKKEYESLSRKVKGYKSVKALVKEM